MILLQTSLLTPGAMNLKIGIDFDNTIVSYDSIFHKYALREKWIDSTVLESKNAVRNSIREKLGNDVWIKLQAIVYGEAMSEAAFTPGAEIFLRWCRTQKIPFFIISHKTQYAANDKRKDLRTPAIEWMKAHDFFSRSFLGLKIGEHVFFEATRKEKFDRMKRCGITHFIDDLQEVLLDSQFPKSIEPLYYNPRHEKCEGIFKSFSSWEDIIKHLDCNIDDNPLFRIVKTKLNEDVRSLSTISSGPKRVAYKVETNKNTYFVKSYALRKSDPRKPWLNEFLSLKFLKQLGFDNIPSPILFDDSEKISIFSHIKGVHFASEEITENHLDQALQFFVALQDHRKNAEHDIPMASEACFSVKEYIEHNDERLQKLSRSKNKMLNAFLYNDLIPTWKDIKERVVVEAKQNQVNLTSVLPMDKRILSPSDVGFHNILKEAGSGRLMFIDFEYFGFDDPLKMMCDFMLEPAVPLPKSLKDKWVREFIQAFHLTNDDKVRQKLLYPILSFKWCLIVLNIFLNEDEDQKLLNTQFFKSKAMLVQLQTEFEKNCLLK